MAVVLAAEQGHNGWRQYEDLELPRILSAAVDAFYDHGFHGTSVRDIATRVGIAVPSLYHHYESKQQILASVIERNVMDLWNRLQAAAAEAPDDPQQTLANLIECLMLHILHRTRMSAVAAELRYLDAQYRRRYEHVVDAVHDLFAQNMAAGLRSGVFHFQDADETARALVGMCRAMTRWHSPTPERPMSYMVALYVDMGLRLAGASSPTRSA